MDNNAEREAAGIKLLDVGLGMVGDQPVVILSYQGPSIDSMTLANVINVDFATKRQVPANEVKVFHVKNNEILI